MLYNQVCKYILAFLLLTLVTPATNAETKDQHIKVALRTIGHEFLLQIDDSTSRILPIKKIDGRYALKIDRAFSFEPDLLFFATFKVLEKDKITESYIVEVEKCGTKEIVHSFEANLTHNQDAIACKERALPEGCYVFYFTVIEPKGVYVKENTASSNMNYTYTIFTLVVCAILYLIIKKRGSKVNQELIAIGQYQFDQKGMSLIFNSQPIELSSKETDLLSLLVSNENKTLERDHILNIVWADEGNYVGRTLDVYISKLRKKLEEDSSIKIINVRGIGYRFVVN